MGGTLARALAEAGCDVTVWNRSRNRAVPLAELGCKIAATAADAIAASPLTVLCVFNESAAHEVLALDGVQNAVAGKVVANLSTIAPETVGQYAGLVRAAGGTHLSGGILCYPRSIGESEAVIVYSGDRVAFDTHADTLAMLAGGQSFVGDRDGDASVFYTAGWVYYYGGLGGFFEAAAYAARAQVDLDQFETLIPTVTRELIGGVQDAVRRIHSDDYSGEQATVDGHVDGVGTFAEALRAAGLKPAITDGFVTHSRRAAEAGLGGEDIAAVVKPMRKP
jgi:3-hydroxyisobutyrate dehydrogenase-like beta-hydroxyacid dehydrogenase